MCVWIDDNVCLLTHSEYASIVCVYKHGSIMYSMCVSGAQWERGGERRPPYSQRQEFLLSDVAREKGRRSREEGNRGCSSGPGWWSRIYDRRDTALDLFTGDSWLLEGV